MDSQSRTSLTLLERVTAHDAAAWERLIFLYSPLVYAWCRQCGVSSHDAGDLMQEVFLTVHRTFDGFHRDQSGDTFRGWLWVITRNKVRDHFRSHEQRVQATGGTAAQVMIQQVPDEEPLESSSIVGTPQDPIYQRGLELVKSEFEDKTWKAFWRFAVDGVKAVDVASELGMSAGAVRKAKLRVMRRLQEELRDLIS
jgi:RNA polymerase sigma-70 factor (ECF subfamily)